MSEHKYAVKVTAPKAEKRKDGNSITVTFDFAGYVEGLEKYQSSACIASWVIALQNVGRTAMMKSDNGKFTHSIGEVEAEMLAFNPATSRATVRATKVDKINKSIGKLEDSQKRELLDKLLAELEG